MKNVEDIYPVSPMQEVMLLHAVTHGADDSLFNQFCYTIDARVDPDAFQRAWQQTLDRHGALRTGFVWQKVERPLQVVRKALTLPLERLDWRERAASRQELDFAAWCEADRQRAFDPQRPPLMRIALVRRADASWHFVWSSHHLLLDRWCLGTVLADFDRFYAAQLAGAPLATGRAPSFRDYIQWLQDQDTDRAGSFWRYVLRDVRRPTTVVSGRGHGNMAAATADELLVDHQQLQSLRSFARAHGVTLGTVVQAGWALTLNRLTGLQDVVFGATVSGRPHEVADVESIVGSFVNNLPVRVQLRADETIHGLLAGMQTAQMRRSPFEYVSPVDLHRCSGLRHGQPLFDSLLVWLVPVDGAPSRPLPMRAIYGDFATAYPFTLSVSETTDALTLRGLLRGEAAVSVGELLRMLHTTLVAISESDADATLASIDGFRHDVDFVTLDLDAQNAPARVAHPIQRADDVSASSGREMADMDFLTDFLRAEWQQVLAVDEIRDDDDFFALGGNSIRAAQLHTRIEAGMRQTIPILTLFQDASLRRMATALSRGDWPVKSDIAVCLREHGDGRPLFCVASSEVNTIGYSMLMRHLETRQRVYVLQAPPDSDGAQRMLPDDLPGLATRYVKAMREIQDTGPYNLLGMCGGAHIAMEMTRALEATNQRASFLGIVNTWGLYTVSGLYYVNRMLNIARYYRGRVRQLFSSPRRSPAIDESAQPVAAPPLPPKPIVDADEEIGPDNPWIRDAGFASRDPGRPRIMSAITVFRIKPQQYWRIRDEGLGWSKQSNDVQIVRLPGSDHDAILREPLVRDIATEIDKLLRHEPQAAESPFHTGTITPTGSAL